ncbi:bifunctional phosphoribosyl-AMP cyclohydrolase/phosphoribosyl-ATP diphosphatase HisIE [Blattabacterium cuenoti]|uniref:bifunctional phosphoribosyl-AMP cyclohydrolase/phosphoribosyl-ATP diphosphatase HisIE n=1 Tax=Blattabacterium cuenoti TaxID=1653831 RepID=UPI00163BA20E|nr:bifunctional phosphoribosyl-AMP cyclohydrolase/phosphoribosyl-ATP diphosphatase HisIE [Blattabacterium cuenoti]
MYSISKKIFQDNQLIPVIVQDNKTNKVLMLGYMNLDAFEQSLKLNKVTFYSRSKKRLWTKGEISKHYLLIKNILIDCDQDTLLIKAIPTGPICHTGMDTCWQEINQTNFLFQLENIISDRKNKKIKNSYVVKLIEKGINRIAQKLGEEAIEMIIESKNNNNIHFLNEAADVLFHYIILLSIKECSIHQVIDLLQHRNTYKSIKN